ncbi:MAG: hypothetical protein ACFE96_17410 [Candidatus Hermodarchaeota archaeon]
MSMRKSNLILIFSMFQSKGFNLYEILDKLNTWAQMFDQPLPKELKREYEGYHNVMKKYNRSWQYYIDVKEVPDCRQSFLKDIIVKEKSDTISPQDLFSRSWLEFKKKIIPLLHNLEELSRTFENSTNNYLFDVSDIVSKILLSSEDITYSRTREKISRDLSFFIEVSFNDFRRIKSYVRRLLTDFLIEKLKELFPNGLDNQYDVKLFPRDPKENLIGSCFKNFGTCTIPIDIDAHKVFVLMPFSEAFNSIYAKGIKRAFEELKADWHVIRADEDLTLPENICKVCKSIQEAGVIVADLTDRNPNVFFELGLAFGLEKRYILLSQDYDLPFDMRTFNVIVYAPKKIAVLKQNIKQTLTALFPDISPK